MRKGRVLVVDDAAAARTLITRALESDPELEVVGTAPSGRLALVRIPLVEPDVVVLDLTMPGLDGLETLSALRRLRPHLPVVMFSSQTAPGSSAAVDALFRGASDCVAKPRAEQGLAGALEAVRVELVPRVKALCGLPAPAVRLPATPAMTVTRSEPRPVEAVAIGVSTGGPVALATVLSKLPADFPVPIIIVQHMPATFTAALAKRLDEQAKLSVAEASSQQTLHRGEVWLAPGDYHLEVRREGGTVKLVTSQGPPENACRPSADVLFRSMAGVYGAGVLGVVLTGMGRDGLRGCQAVRTAGGQILAQDEASSVIWGMPRAVAQAGLAQAIVSLEGMAAELVARVGKPHGRQLARARGEVEPLWR